MFAYPKQAEFNRILPKDIIYKNAKPSSAVKKRFVTEVSEIVWQYKLSKDTINLPPKDGIMEIQVFKITLKVPEPGRDVLKVIDKAVPYPIFYCLRFEDRVNYVTAHKRISSSKVDKCIIVDYFETGWADATRPEIPLPVALDLKSLYEQMMVFYIGLQIRANESLEELVERSQKIRKKERELQTLESKMAKEKQFKKKVDINVQMRSINGELAALKEE
ncbi:MAG: DUF4391 domain-containing protein [Candidatus Loosdrechtia sp.]|uniref:DUF4391 domain-containing protein n=1 Tax=Candidatus Loosdrechtia sp. TaxID=3101272 RepID=UPI003A782199|nr:MAG: DUF4391 domain-containing protein [Candidatus Jettenia sp. AMX2]